MAMRLKDLKVVDLKRELKERDADTNGKKKDLSERLRKVMEGDGGDPETTFSKWMVVLPS